MNSTASQAVDQHLREQGKLAPPSVVADFSVANCGKCDNLSAVKRELGRINRQLGNLKEQIENTILSLE